MNLHTLIKYDRYFVALWGAILFIPFLGSVHLFDWDEINFAESAREMLVTGNFQQVQINFQPFLEKPPLFFWLQAASMQLFGVNEFAARLPNALVGIISLMLAYTIAKKHFRMRVAFLWVLCITGSFTPHLYFKSGIIDPLYNLFIFSAIYQLFLFSSNEANKNTRSILLGLFTGLAILTKGPVAVLVILLCFGAYLSLTKFKLFFNWKHFLMVLFATFFTSALWFGVETVKNGPQFLLAFIQYQLDLFLNPVAGHGQPFWYHPLVLFLGCFPVSIFALREIFIIKTEQNQFVLWMKILFWVVLILFSAVETKIVHYSSLCYLPLTFIAAYSINAFFENKAQFKKWQVAVFMLMGVLLSLAFTFVTLIDNFKHIFIPFIKDDFTIACLSINADWKGFELIFGMSLLSVVMVSSFYFFRSELPKGFVMILFFISCFIPAFLRIVVPKIEAYSQRPAIEFYQTLQNKNCYVETIGFKSYAHYFYARTQPNVNPNAADKNWLIAGEIDKPAYFVIKVNDTAGRVAPDMNELYAKGGFVFYKRENLK